MLTSSNINSTPTTICEGMWYSTEYSKPIFLSNTLLTKPATHSKVGTKQFSIKKDTDLCSLPEENASNNETEPADDSNETKSSTRSDDELFLRPIAVASYSPPLSVVSTSSSTLTSLLLGNHLVKRTSIDSGINMDMTSSSLLRPISRSNKTMRDHQFRFSRGDRSMSLPISSSPFLTFNSSNSITTAALATAKAAAAAAASDLNSCDPALDSLAFSIDSAIDPNSFYSAGSNTSLNMTSLLSPSRKMDFSLCKYKLIIHN